MLTPLCSSTNGSQRMHRERISRYVVGGESASTGCFLHRFIGNLITSCSDHTQGGGITRRRNYYLVPNNAG